MILEIVGIMEGILIGYLLFGNNNEFKSIALFIFILLVGYSIIKTKSIYQSRCGYNRLSNRE